MSEEEKIYRIKTKQTNHAAWYLVGCKSKDNLYFKKWFIKNKPCAKFNLVFEGQPQSIKPFKAQEFLLDKHPVIRGYTLWVK